MRLLVNKSKLSGSVEIPGSKSHTIRAVAIASLAQGASVIRKPLRALDTMAAVNAFRLLGAEISISDDWLVRGVAGRPGVPENIIDVGNSGTTLYIALGAACLSDGCSVFTGDDQIRRRPAQPLIEALNELGATVESTRCNGLAPIIVRGPMRGGFVKLDGSKTSQYLTSLLINCPLAQGDTTIEVENLIEKTLCGDDAEVDARAGNQAWRAAISGVLRFREGSVTAPFDRSIPADFSSAAFFLCAAAITGADLTLLGLDMNDVQGDKAVVDVLVEMGAQVEQCEGGLRIVGGKLKGAEFDLSDTPDALPALAAAACFAEGETRLVNVGQARLKETDRIAVMCAELGKMGADIQELPDGLIIRGS